ncbi:hypothetical protein [Longispora albida]|uniref:hypothetical protein n=1 Tax=Longispora albida TaxID=203523 RepID=UPI000378A812|nr:hypothetical protein [Longispora albida]
MRVTFATEPAQPGVPNEDFVAATEDAVIVIDGVGTTGIESGCIHDAPWYVGQLGRTLLNHLSTRPGHGLDVLLADAIRDVAASHADTCDTTHPGTPSATVVILRQHLENLDYLVLADSTLVLDQGDEPLVICDNRHDDVAQHLWAEMASLPVGTTEHAQARARFMVQMQKHRNSPGGFWVAAADPTVAKEAIRGSVPASTVKAAALLSDGASRFVDVFEEANWPQTLALLAADGPSELLRQTRAIEAADPHGERWHRGKVSDDATVAYCTDFTR